MMKELTKEEIAYLRDVVLASTLQGNNTKIGGKVLRKLDDIHATISKPKRIEV